jgi:hypothetical protein
MKALDILKRCRAARTDISRLQQRIDRWREMLDSIGAPQADPNGGSRGSADPDKVGRIMGEIDALEREIARRKEGQQAEAASALALLDTLPDLESKILYAYYVKRQDTPEIARKEKYTAGYVRKVKRGGETLLDMLSAERVTATLPAWYLREEEDK